MYLLIICGGKHFVRKISDSHELILININFVAVKLFSEPFFLLLATHSLLHFEKNSDPPAPLLILYQAPE